MTDSPPFRLDSENQCLWRDTERITLTPKAFFLLKYLVERAGRLVTHTELLESLWPNSFVQPEVLEFPALRRWTQNLIFLFHENISQGLVE